VADRTWSCKWASDHISFVRSELGRLRLLRYWGVPDGGGPCLNRCVGCRNNHNYCKGWRFSFSGPNAMRFTPTRLRRGTTVNVVFEGDFNFQREAVPTRPEDWTSKPARSMTTAIVLETEAGQPITRQHLDLANPGQPGPLWHLQLGGVPMKGTALTGIDVPRWPGWPVDFLLMVELVLFNFFPAQWVEAQRSPAWKAALQQSEKLVLSHYIARYQHYRRAEPSHPSWLGAQCGVTSGWNPRPD
jgi:hypothetical protein